MTLPTSGPLTFANIQTEFGGSNPIGLNEYYAGGSYVASGTTGTYGAVPSSGQIGVQNFYGTSAFVPTYIEQVFSTYLYKGTGATQSIVNNIALSTSGGMVWIKDRSAGVNNNLWDTTRGVGNYIVSNTTSAQANAPSGVSSFNSNGFTQGASFNASGDNLVSWTFRKQAKFFDVVSYTGNATEGYAINHNLGSVPGCIIVKDLTSGSNDWCVYHQSLGNTKAVYLNTTQTPITFDFWANTTPTATQFYVANMSKVNTSGNQYIAYLFASNAGGFGASGADNVITCGNFTADGSGNATVNLGYEPQWILTKRTSSATDWHIYDTMRGFTADNISQQVLYPNLTTAEQTGYPYAVKSTGFSLTGVNGGDTFIYIAIRKGPMAVPTTGTSVFTPISATATTGTSRTVGFRSDTALVKTRNGSSGIFMDRLRGFANSNATGYPELFSNLTNAESVSGTPTVYNVWNTTALDGDYFNGAPTVFYHFQRAPSFFDEVICTQTGSAQNVNHNLTVAPELIILKDRTSAVSWQVGTNFTATTWTNLVLNLTNAGSTGAYNNYINAQPTSTVFRLGGNLGSVGDSFATYLFATCAGVSKVGSYTGTGTLTTINCGFAGGARFVLIKRTDTTSNWFVWDTARGMTAGTDPAFYLNTADPQANANSVYTITTGFQLLASPSEDVNTNGGTYIYLAIA